MQGLSSFGSFNPLPEMPNVATTLPKAAAQPAESDTVSSTTSSDPAPVNNTPVSSAGGNNARIRTTQTAEGAAAAGGSHAGGGGTSTVSLLAAQELVSGYAMTVGGQQYAADVEQSGGNYTASINTVPGVSVTAPTELTAETNLQLRIDELA